MKDEETEEPCCLLHEEAGNLCGATLCHRLLRGTGCYWIEAQYRGQTARVRVEAGFLLTTAIYGKVVRGGVTPCTLADVVEDLLTAAVLSDAHF